MMPKCDFKEDLEVVLLDSPVGNCSKCIFHECFQICDNYMICRDDNGMAVNWKMRRGGQCDAILAAQYACNRGVDTQNVCRQKIAAAIRARCDQEYSA
ncbi:hypothetical protein HDR63_00695 [bacterium]|nr:hypothetical protein [bacterium]